MIALRVILLLVALLLTPLVQAAKPTNKVLISKEQAVTLVQQHYQGKIMKLRADKRYYQVRVLQNDGHVITVLVDNQTGKVHKDRS
ncbi:PepSY domain-containing protein [Rheinheimera sp. MMS21-TC3]|uniref:PepSY domain-containing protein n=1 Tax=Rheinheimera sp. MMS21-TC3 TaxID=3072790 RepID=UPI0028C45962|nr:PepSY domain-containing protein [Rheinheimera sp. MMS21-TC3]WNO60710.1 PepSY domain-containing protein [Rheinheimera sp. MMS21-TC3]